MADYCIKYGSDTERGCTALAFSYADAKRHARRILKERSALERVTLRKLGGKGPLHTCARNAKGQVTCSSRRKR